MSSSGSSKEKSESCMRFFYRRLDMKKPQTFVWGFWIWLHKHYLSWKTWLLSYFWSRGSDSNRHVISDSGFWVRRVYQFHHLGKSAMLCVAYHNVFRWLVNVLLYWLLIFRSFQKGKLLGSRSILKNRVFINDLQGICEQCIFYVFRRKLGGLIVFYVKIC